MKSIFLIIILTMALFSNEKQIIVGSFLKEKYASNSLVKLNNHVLMDDKLSALINKNDINVELKTIGKYNVLSLSPFDSYVQLLRTLKELEEYYDDAYVLDNATKIKIEKEVIEEKVAIIQEQAQKIEKIKLKEIPEKDNSVEVITHKKITPVKKDSEEQTNYTLEFVLAFLLLVGSAYIIYIRFKGKKEEPEK